jgi:hypothetical protein
MPSSGLQSIWIRLPSTDVLGFTHIVPQGGTSGFHDTVWNPGAPYGEIVVVSSLWSEALGDLHTEPESIS